MNEEPSSSEGNGTTSEQGVNMVTLASSEESLKAQSDPHSNYEKAKYRTYERLIPILDELDKGATVTEIDGKKYYVIPEEHLEKIDNLTETTLNIFIEEMHND